MKCANLPGQRIVQPDGKIFLGVFMKTPPEDINIKISRLSKKDCLLQYRWSLSKLTEVLNRTEMSKKGTFSLSV